MNKVSVYCCTIENCRILEKLPSYITPVGLGNKIFKILGDRKKWENISKLNSYYAELTMYYWCGKINLKSMKKMIL